MSSTAGGGGEGELRGPSTAAHRSPNKLWRSNSIFNPLCIFFFRPIYSETLLVIPRKTHNKGRCFSSQISLLDVWQQLRTSWLTKKKKKRCTVRSVPLFSSMHNSTKLFMFYQKKEKSRFSATFHILFHPWYTYGLSVYWTFYISALSGMVECLRVQLTLTGIEKSCKKRDK